MSRRIDIWFRFVAYAATQVKMPNTSSEPMSAFLRPKRSPIQPKKIEPTRMPTRLAASTGPSAARLTPQAFTSSGAASAIAAMS